MSEMPDVELGVTYLAEDKTSGLRQQAGGAEMGVKYTVSGEFTVVPGGEEKNGRNGTTQMMDEHGMVHYLYLNSPAVTRKQDLAAGQVWVYGPTCRYWVVIRRNWNFRLLPLTGGGSNLADLDSDTFFERYPEARLSGGVRP